MPKRIQRKRTRGYKTPAGAIYVGRPTVWGNPFGFVRELHGDDLALKLYAELARGCWDPSIVKDLGDEIFAKIYDAHHKWLRRMGRHPVEAAMSDLRGHDLSCFCNLSQPCHADILLELANTWKGH